MTEKQIQARLVAFDTAIGDLEHWECDPGDENAEEEMRQAKILAAQLNKQADRWLKTIHRRRRSS